MHAPRWKRAQSRSCDGGYLPHPGMWGYIFLSGLWRIDNHARGYEAQKRDDTEALLVWRGAGRVSVVEKRVGDRRP